MRVLLVAAEAAGAHVLRAIESAGFSVAGLLMSSGEGGERPLGNSVAATVARLGCPVWPARGVRDPAFANVVREAQVDILINVHSLYVIRPEILDAPRIGSFNMHPGPLPECAGLNAVSWALYEGKREHGVTVHWMAAGIDTGPVAYERRFDIDATDTALSLSAKCVKLGVPLIERLLMTAATSAEQIPRHPQDLSRRQYRGREIPQGGLVEWWRPAREIVNFVRACDYLPFASPWGHPKASIGGQEVAILKAELTGVASNELPGTVGERRAGGVLVSARQEWVLVRRLLADGRVVNAADVFECGRRFDEVLAPS